MVKALSTNCHCYIESIILPTEISLSAQEAVYKLTSAAIEKGDRLKYFPLNIRELILKWIQCQQSNLNYIFANISNIALNLLLGSVMRGLRKSANTSILDDSVLLRNDLQSEYCMGERCYEDKLSKYDFEFTGPPSGATQCFHLI